MGSQLCWLSLGCMGLFILLLRYAAMQHFPTAEWHMHFMLCAVHSASVQSGIALSLSISFLHSVVLYAYAVTSLFRRTTCCPVCLYRCFTWIGGQPRHRCSVSKSVFHSLIGNILWC